MIANLRGHVAHQRLKYRFLGIEVGVEGTQCDAGALRDSDDRAVRKSAFAELVASGVEDLAKRPLATCSARRLAIARRAQLRFVTDLSPHPSPLTFTQLNSQVE